MNKMGTFFRKNSRSQSEQRDAATTTHLERDGVDDALALHPLQTSLHNGELGRIDHERDLCIGRTTTQIKLFREERVTVTRAGF